MSNMMRRLAIALSVLFVVGLGAGSAEAQKARAKSAKPAKAKAAKKSYKFKDGRQARGPILRNLRKKGHSTNVRVTALGRSESGKSLQAAAAHRHTGKVRWFNVRESNGVAYETKTQAVKQKKANSKANRKLRRQDGTFSGINRSGLSNSGKSYEYNSATDRSAENGDKAYIGVESGKARVYVRGE